MLASLLTLLLPLFLRRVLQDPTHIGNFVALFLASAVATLAGRAKDQICRVLSVRASSVLSLAIFQKSVRFSNLAQLRSPVGKVLGSSTTDMMLVRNYVLKVHDIWSSPLQLLLIAFMIVRLLGISGVVGKDGASLRDRNQLLTCIRLCGNVTPSFFPDSGERCGGCSSRRLPAHR